MVNSVCLYVDDLQFHLHFSSADLPSFRFVCCAAAVMFLNAYVPIEYLEITVHIEIEIEIERKTSILKLVSKC